MQAEPLIFANGSDSAAREKRTWRESVFLTTHEFFEAL